VTPEAESRVAEVARDSRPRLVAVLAAAGGDPELAADAVQEALERAVRLWPHDGVPDRPEAWLFTVARNHMRDHWRSAAVRRSLPLLQVPDPPSWPELDPEALPDRRLELLFVCAHPAISPAARTPLMLQVVLGVEAARIARAYAVPASTMAQRLVRAKRRITQARIPFVLPDRSDFPGRLTSVLEAVYGAFALDLPGPEADVAPDSLAGEALALAGMLTELLPDDAEVLGLHALIGTTLAWSTGDEELLRTSAAMLSRAHALGKPGRFQIEAAIQAAHVHGERAGATDWPAVVALHEGLLAVAPTLGAVVSYAAAVGEADGAKAGLGLLQKSAEDDDRLTGFQPYWAVRAHLLSALGETEAAHAAFTRAIDLSTDPEQRRTLADRREALLR
jgi:RNA polymerase sigma-70 factor (ECF subfamily)